MKRVEKKKADVYYSDGELETLQILYGRLSEATIPNRNAIKVKRWIRALETRAFERVHQRELPNFPIPTIILKF